MDLFTLISVLRITVITIGVYRLVDETFSSWIGTTSLRVSVATFLPLTVAFTLNYRLAIFGYYQDRMNQRKKDKNLPPKCPELLPFMGNAIHSLWNQPAFLKKVGYASKREIICMLYRS